MGKTERVELALGFNMKMLSRRSISKSSTGLLGSSPLRQFLHP